jgi:uncharacterized membrane protein YczE
MHVPSRVRGGLVARSVSLVFGLFLFALAVVFQLESRLGLSPWDVLHQGVAKHTPLSFGEAIVVVGVFVVAFARSLGAGIGIGTVANAVLVGGFTQALTSMDWVGGLADDPLGVRIALLVAAMPLFGVASALYIGAGMGAGPRDSLMVVISARSRLRLGLVRAGLELLALAAGFALGGKVGIGTVVFALTIGPALEAGFWLLRRSPIGVPPAPAATPVPAPLVGS